MKLSTLFIINAILAILFGLGFILAPEAVLAPYGIATDSAGIALARLLGVSFIEVGILAWLARNIESTSAVRVITLAYFIGNAVGFIVTLIDQLGGLANALGWTTVAIYLLLALGYGYFQFGQQSASTQLGKA